jgi:hypothetical protein
MCSVNGSSGSSGNRSTGCSGSDNDTQTSGASNEASGSDDSSAPSGVNADASTPGPSATTTTETTDKPRNLNEELPPAPHAQGGASTGGGATGSWGEPPAPNALAELPPAEVSLPPEVQNVLSANPFVAVAQLTAPLVAAVIDDPSSAAKGVEKGIWNNSVGDLASAGLEALGFVEHGAVVIGDVVGLDSLLGIDANAAHAWIDSSIDGAQEIVTAEPVNRAEEAAMATVDTAAQALVVKSLVKNGFEAVGDFGRWMTKPDPADLRKALPDSLIPNPAKIDDAVAFGRAAEERAARRLADSNREFDGLTFTPVSPDPGHDWVDNLGRTYDAMGDGTKAEFFQFDQFTRQIDRHLRKGNDFTVIDMTGYNADQIAAVRDYVDRLPADKQAMITRVGF